MSLGPRITVEYHLPGADHRRTIVVEGDGRVAGNGAQELGIAVAGDQRVRRLYVRPSKSVVVDKIVAIMHLRLADADALYLNGYNSWTDSIERPVNDRMWGLARAPRTVVQKYVLDGIGDYRFEPQDTRCGHMHGFGYCYVRQGNRVLLMGSLNEDSGLTAIREDLDAGALTFEKEPPAQPLVPGQKRELLSLCVTGGKLEDAVDEWLALAGVSCREARPIVGYTSWYRHYDRIDSHALAHDLEAAARVLGAMELGGIDSVFQIDDGYATVGDWLEYDRARFPQTPGDLATKARSVGLLPGIWLAPFVCSRASRVFAEHPDWLLRDELGQPVMTGDHWGGAFALNTRNAEVRSYLANVLRTITQEWGFGLLKLDFLYGACMLPHDGMNRGELMADALDLLRASVGENIRLLFCGVPLALAFGRCEYCRVGCDVCLDWDDKPHARLLHRERVSTKNSLANARGRAHLDGRAFRCDPDVLFLRKEGVSFTDGQYEEMLRTDTTCGGVLLTSDDMGSWNAHQLERFRAAVDAFRRYNNM